MRKTNFGLTSRLAIGLSLVLGSVVYAASTSNFTQQITAGSLAVDIVDSTDNYSTVASPAISFTGKSFSFQGQTSTGTFGSSTQAIYVTNPDDASNWTVDLAASDTEWSDGSHSFKYNKADGSGFTYGQMSVNPSVGTLTNVYGSGSGVSKGSSGAFDADANPEPIDAITILQGSSAETIGAYKLTGVAVSQKIPALQPSGDYSIMMSLSANSI